jgi:hypothetical protein
MTAIKERSETAEELYSRVQSQYLQTLEMMFFHVPAAKAHFEVGNVVTSFRLLSEAHVQINRDWGISKEMMLNSVMQVIPSMYQIGDMDPDFVPETR